MKSILIPEKIDRLVSVECLLVVLAVAGAGVVIVSTLASSTVNLDTVALAGDTEAVASARRRLGGEGRERGEGRGTGAAGDGGSGVDGGSWAGASLAVEGSLLELLGKILGGDLVVSLADGAGSVGLGGLWALDLAWGEGSALWDLSGLTVGAGSAGSGGGWDIEDVERAASGGLLGGWLGGIVGDVVAVHDVVVPVALASLESGSLEAEGSLPATGLSGVLGKRKLSGVVVP